jgi:hypothetical protein
VSTVDQRTTSRDEPFADRLARRLCEAMSEMSHRRAAELEAHDQSAIDSAGETLIGIFNFTVAALAVMDRTLSVRPGHHARQYRDAVKRHLIGAVIEMHAALE